MICNKTVTRNSRSSKRFVRGNSATLSSLTGISLLPITQEGTSYTGGLKTQAKICYRNIKTPRVKRTLVFGISFCIDEAGFHHKYNPFDEAKSIKTLAWRKRDEGLERNCANLVQETWANLVQEITTVSLR